MRLNPVLDGPGHIPVRAPRRGQAPAAAARGVELIDFGDGRAARGDARVHPPALADGDRRRCRPTRRPTGCPSCGRRSPAWVARRFGARAGPRHRGHPDARLQGGGLPPRAGRRRRRRGGHDARLPGRRARRARSPGARWSRCRWRPGAGFLPDLDALSPAVLDRLAILWLNYPNNPTGATIPLESAASAPPRWRASTTSSWPATRPTASCGSRATPPASALQLADRTNVAALNTLSKRSSMPGYRSGFVAGDPALIAALKRYRPNVGVAPQEFVQRASIAAWQRRGARRARCASATAPSATCCCPRC